MKYSPYKVCVVLSSIVLLTAFLTSASAKGNRAIDEKAGGTKNAVATAPAKPASATKTQLLLPGDRCTGDPKFLEKIGMSKRALVDTTSTHAIGMIVTDVTAQGQKGRSSQHESWKQAGALGRVQRDRDGNIYTYPVPSVSLVNNPVEKANIVYRIESETGVMAPFAELPKVAPATEQNPFGLLALALDCEANALYAASIYGSTASSENGVIARIDLTTKEINELKRGIDALSILVAFDGRGKRLYVGTARDNVVVSYGFKKDGTLADDEAIEIKLDDVKSAQDKRARVLRVDGRGRLYVRAIPFEYTLAARSTIPTTEMNFAQTSSGADQAKFVLVDQKTSEPRALADMSAPTVPADAGKR
jgi:hypothetical protein